MHINMIIRNKATRIWAIFGVCSFGLYTTACDSGEIPVKEENAANIELRFTASISDNPSVKTAYGATFTKANAHGPAVLQGTAFGDDRHTFGMWITGETGGALVIGSNDNMQAILDKNGTTNTWNYADNGGTPLTLQAKQGENIKITGYYPWIDGATNTAVPFDFSVAANSKNWKDLLYLSSPAYDATSPVTDANSIDLTFSHAYCWVTITLSKLTDKSNVAVSAVSIENGGTEGWIKNKGSINPKTGKVASGATSGVLKITCPDGHTDLPVEGGTGGSAFEYNFLVPPFMDKGVQNSDILIRVFTSDNKVLSFPLQRAHLNKTDPDFYGLKQGMHNTYNIVYNNSSMILSVSDWQEVVINDQALGGGPTGGITNGLDVFGGFGNSFSEKTVLPTGNHILHTYLGEVVESNNGGYVTVPDITGSMPSQFNGWAPFIKAEPLYGKLIVAKDLAAGGAPVQWKDENGVLAAKQACAELRDGGFTDWRLPRLSELFLFVYQTPSDLRPERDQLWSGTEHDADNSYATYRYGTGETTIFPKITPKKTSLYVRCVRDADKPKPTI